METRTYLRSLDRVYEDLLWPDADFFGPDPEKSIRHWAIAEVLCSIPTDDYERLRALAGMFTWFIPHPETYGCGLPFYAQWPEEPLGGDVERAPYALVLYLSPLLERASCSIAVAVVAHELAHLVLGHPLEVDPRLEEGLEEQAWALVRKWGFEKEERAHRALRTRCRRREEAASGSTRCRAQPNHS